MRTLLGAALGCFLASCGLAACSETADSLPHGDDHRVSVTADGGGAREDAQALDALAEPDAAEVDAGATDTGATDTGAIDTGAIDTGASDTGVLPDLGLRDSGAPADGGSRDSGAPRDASGSADASSTSDAGSGTPGLPRFRFPIEIADRVLISRSPIFGVDHDPAMYSGLERFRCRNYEDRAFPWCYDGHDGSDFMLDGGFATMDLTSARIVAAAGGVVIATADGNYDRCHADLASGDVSCDGRPMRANYVDVRHAGGWVTRYFHMKSGSVAVRVGDTVTCGTFLGLVGSSGYSSAPHLHFEVKDGSGRTWDPFAGQRSQPETLWANQAPGDGLPADICDPAWTTP